MIHRSMQYSGWNKLIVAQWRHMATPTWLNIGSGNVLLPDGTKSLPEPTGENFDKYNDAAVFGTRRAIWVRTFQWCYNNVSQITGNWNVYSTDRLGLTKRTYQIIQITKVKEI